MQFLKILFWCLLAFIAAVFTLGNWTWVSIRLWGGLIAEANLPFLLLIAFLVGLVPTLVHEHWKRWRLRQRLQSAERQLAVLRAAPPVAPPLPATPSETAAAESALLPGQLS